MRWWVGFLLLCSTAGMAQDGRITVFARTAELLALCTSDDPMQHGYCAGFTSAVVDSYRLHPAAPLFCKPSGAGTDALRDTFVAYARARREEWERAAAAVMLDALRARWPCAARGS